MEKDALVALADVENVPAKLKVSALNFITAQIATDLFGILPNYRDTADGLLRMSVPEEESPTNFYEFTHTENASSGLMRVTASSEFGVTLREFSGAIHATEPSPECPNCKNSKRRKMEREYGGAHAVSYLCPDCQTWEFYGYTESKKD